MKTSLVLACATVGFGLAAATTQDAPETTNNPVGVVYKAEFPDRDSTDIRGTVSATAHSSGRGVVFEFDLTGFDEENGPFPYHIHVDPVPANGSCTATLDHLDPFGRGQKPPCDTPNPETCEPGDLSGKHGKIDVSGDEHFMAKYHELYVATQQGLGTFFGNRSIVIHAKNGTRLTCANFALVDHSGCSTGTMPRPTGTGVMSTRIPTGTGIGGGHMPMVSATYTPTATPSSLPDQSNGAGRLAGFSLGAIMAALVPLAL
ncbi:cu-Zn superoxide dismutase [Nannizzia gypsea CBS 118893]|uniref:superoxide dismutase n=1 Tax=Arthroderma gypseum (strain ATCC MYA-4604 / CBS 118893) TaxID=535722 RepID=E4UTR5_ARTGP|nr:cu-Zn superoxide dismutase [Nannizzia gypsea CBS 118893]EFR01558.1 cu-Zn superoxide dismutase [Nannizzia gypsea CBS 118893]